MSVFFKIAWRNVLRNRRRSLITVAAIAIGLAALIFLWSFQKGVQHQMISNITSMITGDIQINKKGAEGLYNTNVVIENPAEVREVLSRMPEVALAVERVVGGGIVASAERSMTTFIVGGIPELENQLVKQTRPRSGRALEDRDEKGIVLGYKLAVEMEVGVGDKVVLYSQDFYGGLAAELFRVVGTYETGSDQVDYTTVYILLPTAQKMLSLGESVTKFIVILRDPEAVDQILAGLKDELEPKGLVVRTWREIVPMMYQMHQFQRSMLYIVLGVVLVIVGSGILNTLLMSVTQRIREFGLMASLGSRAGQIGQVVVLESLILGAMGALVGVGVGVGLALWFGRVGIDLAAFTQAFSNLFVGSVVYTRVEPFGIVMSLAIVLVCNIAASLYPAWKAARLEPIEAMRHVG